MRSAPDRTAPTTSTVPTDDDDALVRRFGYRPRLARTLGWGESFGAGFSFISVTTGIFTTFGFLLSTAGPRGIWTWPVAVAGQTLVALVYGTSPRGSRWPAGPTSGPPGWPAPRWAGGWGGCRWRSW